MSIPASSVATDAKALKIVTRARALFVERGYAATSMDDVAAVAQISKTTLYKRFPSKALLFAAVIATQALSTGMEIDAGELEKLPAEQALFEIGRRFVKFACAPENVRLELIYHSEAKQLPEVANAFEQAGPQRSIAIVERYFRFAIQQKLLSLEDPHFTAGHFLNAMKGTPSGVSLSPYTSLSSAKKDAHIRKIVQLFLDGARPRN